MFTLWSFDTRGEADDHLDDRSTPVTLVRKGCTITTTVERVHSGDVVVVEPGEIVPVAGEIVEGQTVVVVGDPLSGLVSQPKRPGDSVAAGAINQGATIRVRALKG